MSLLTKIRQRSDGEKKIFSLTVAGLLTIIIVAVWLSSFGGSPNVQTDNSDKLSSISPLQVIKDEFFKAFSNFKQSTSTVEVIEK